MKEDELRQNATCNLCDRKIGESGLPIFYRITIEQFAINPQAVKRQQGLTEMLGGSAAIARVMGPDEDLADEFNRGTVTVCQDCATDLDMRLVQMIEKGLSNDEEE